METTTTGAKTTSIGNITVSNINIFTLQQAMGNGVSYQINADRIERHFCQCYQCHQKATVDFHVIVWTWAWYNEQIEKIVWEPRYIYYRINEDSTETEVRNTYIAQCPYCGTAKPQNSQLKASKVKLSAKHVCDDRCQTAISDGCTCSCGGKNHGIKHKVQGTLF